MELAQLFDPLATFNDQSKSNLVLRRVLDDLAPPIGTPDRKKIEADYAAMEPTIKLIKEWRNAIGAHRSLTTAIALVDYTAGGCKPPHPLPRIPLKLLLGVIQGLVDTTDVLVEQVMGGFQPWYDPQITREIDWIFAALAEPRP